MLLTMVNPILISLLYSCIEPIFKRAMGDDYQIIITRTIDEKIPGKSVSNTHIEGRAIDIRSRDIPKSIAKEIESNLNFNFAKVFGAISLSDNRPRFAVLEPDHFHIQIKSDIPKDILLKLITRGIIYTNMNKNACKF